MARYPLQRYPKQRSIVGMPCEVWLARSTTTYRGTYVRADDGFPHRDIIQLADGSLIIDEECKHCLIVTPHKGGKGLKRLAGHISSLADNLGKEGHPNK